MKRCTVEHLSFTR